MTADVRVILSSRDHQGQAIPPRTSVEETRTAAIERKRALKAKKALVSV